MTYEEEMQLKQEVKELRESYKRNLFEQAQSYLIEEYRLDKKYESLMKVAYDRIQVAGKDTLQDVIGKLDEELKKTCKEFDIEVPGSNSDEFQRFIDSKRAEAEENDKNAEEIKKRLM